MSTTDKKMLTETELELMLIIWKLGEASVKQVQEALPEKRQLAYTSVSTIMRILEKKEALESRKGKGNSYLYKPTIAKADYQKKSITQLLKGVFSKKPSSLVKSLVDSGELTEQDLNEIQKIVSERLKK